jgi:predicted DNA-binding WGR domain protein
LRVRRFECVQGSASKFWEVSVDGDALTVRYGRIGSNGQTQTKSFASAAKALAEHDKLIREKTGKGYLEVGAGSAAAPVGAGSPRDTAAPVGAGSPRDTAAPVAAGSARDAAAPVGAGSARDALGNMTEAEARGRSPLPQAPPADAGGADPQPIASPTPASEPQPPGEFRWTPAWRKALPVWRGESFAAPAPPDRAAAIAEFARRVAKLQAQPAQQRLLSNLMLRPGTPMDAALLDPQLLTDCSDAEHWKGLLRVLMYYTDSYRERTDLPDVQALWQLCASVHGLRFTLRVLCGVITDRGKLGPRALDVWGLEQLRAHIAALADDDYTALHDDAIASDSNPATVGLLAYLFPTEPALLKPAVDALPARVAGYQATPLMACRLDEKQAERVYASTAGYDHSWPIWRELHLNLARLKHPRALEIALDAVQRQHSQDYRRAALDVVRAHDSVAALRALQALVDDKAARPILDEFAGHWPQLAIRLATERLATCTDKPLLDWLERFVAAHREALSAARGCADVAIRPLLDRLVAGLPAQVPEVVAEELPDWLRSPPWRALKRAAALKYPALVAHATAPAMAWRDGERAQWQGLQTPESMRALVRTPELLGKSGDALVAAVLGVFGVPESLHGVALAGGNLDRAQLGRRRMPASGVLMLLPPPAARSVLQAWGPLDWYDFGSSRLESVIGWLDGLAAPLLEDFAERSLEFGLRLAQPLASARVARVAANALRTSKKFKPLAQNWLLRHARVAADALLPLLAERKGAEDAGFALRWLLANGREAAVEAAAESYGADGRAALAALRAFDPLSLAPAKAPTLPSFWRPTGYARPLLHDGRALPAAVLDAIGEMLVFTPLEPRYAGLDRLRELCRPASLGAFASDLFQSWLDAGAPAKEQWAFAALAHLGDDECARRLAKLLRVWPTEGASSRAATGLDVLAAMGSDVALMQLNGIAQKVKSKPLQLKAQAKLEQLAEMRGLSSDELADRLVPELGLDDNGSLLLDFGPRQFSVGFDEHLKPQVRDATGALLKDLPSPLKSDDAALAEAAVARWKALKKDARTLAGQQLLRLELAMAQRRRWSVAEFRQCFVEHPLMRHLARRLLWAEFVDGRPARCLRVAEDLSFADANDDLLTLPDTAEVGLVHALELPPADAAAFGQIFADYEILQPFAQLGREVYRLDDSERAASALTRFQGRKVATGSLVGLDGRGWRKDELTTESGRFAEVVRPLADGVRARMSFAPGAWLGDVKSEPVQTLEAIGLEGRANWGEIDAILASEVLRDVARMAVVK